MGDSVFGCLFRTGLAVRLFDVGDSERRSLCRLGVHVIGVASSGAFVILSDD